jgi:hypothetical protein
VFKRDEDGNATGFSTRFWVYTIIASVIICWIGWRTQDTANKVDAQVSNNTAFVEETNHCLRQVVDVLTTRVGYNDQINSLARRADDLDLRRQAIWEQLVVDLANSNNDDGLNQKALGRFFTANEQIKNDQAALAQAQAELRVEREGSQYPDCAQIEPQR